MLFPRRLHLQLALPLLLVAAPVTANEAAPRRTVEVFVAAGAGGVLTGERVDGTGVLLEIGGLCNVWPHHGFGVRIQLQEGLEPNSYAEIAESVIHQQRWAVFWRWRFQVGTLEPYAVLEYGYESLRLESQPGAFLRGFNVSTNNVGLGAGLRWRLSELMAVHGEAGWWLTPQGGNIGEKRPQQWSARLGLGVSF